MKDTMINTGQWLTTITVKKKAKKQKTQEKETKMKNK